MRWSNQAVWALFSKCLGVRLLRCGGEMTPGEDKEPEIQDMKQNLPSGLNV